MRHLARHQKILVKEVAAWQNGATNTARRLISPFEKAGARVKLKRL
jgi:hypothetical protein